MKRFYKTVAITRQGAGFSINLDGRAVKTPAKALLTLPTQALAEAVQREWEAQEEDVKPDAMPFTQLANTAIDRVMVHHDLVAQEVAAFAGTDLLCYRAGEPEELIKRQEEIWGPYLKWANEALGAKLVTTSGIMPIQQDKSALALFEEKVKAFDAFSLTALHELTNGFGSLVLALACIEKFQPFEEVLTASLIDHTFQEEQWGEDWEVTDKRTESREGLLVACEFLALLDGK